MKLQELQEWIKAHRYVTSERDDYDANGNHDEIRIYTDKEGKFFQIEFCNDHPHECYIKGGPIIMGEYTEPEYSEPVEVFKKTRIEEYYEPKEESGEIYV